MKIITNTVFTLMSYINIKVSENNKKKSLRGPEAQVTKDVASPTVSSRK